MNCKICECEITERELCSDCKDSQEVMAEYFEEENRRLDEGSKSDNNILASLKEILSNNVLDAIKDHLAEDCATVGSLQIVDSKKGDFQKEHFDNDIVLDIAVDQYVNGGYEGDTFEGNEYIKLPNGKYLKFHYEM